MAAARQVQLIIKGDSRSAVAAAKRVETSMRAAGNSVQAAGVKSARMGAQMSFATKQAKAMAMSVGGKLGLAGGVIGAAFALDRMADRAVEVNNVFKVLRINIDGAREAVTGQVDALDLAKNANKLHLGGLKLTSREYADLTGIVAKASDATGQDLAANLDRATKMLLAGNVERAAAMGLTLDQKTAERDYAEELGKTVAELTKAERQQIALNLILKEGKQQTDDLGGATANAAVRWVQLKNGIQDAIDQAILIDQNLRELAITLRQGVEGALMDLGVSAENVERIMNRFGELQRAQWNLLTGNIREARIELEAFAGVAKVTDLVSMRGKAALREKTEREEMALAEARAADLRKVAEDAAANGEGGGDGGGSRRGGGRRAPKPELVDDLMAQTKAREEGTREGALDDFLASDDMTDARVIRMEEYTERQRVLSLERQEMARQEAAVEAEAHDARVKQMEVEMAKERQKQKRMEEVAQATSQAMSDSVFAAVDAKDQKGKAFAEEIEEFTKSRGRMLIAQSFFHMFMAASSVMSLNPVAAAGHLSAAAFLGVKGGALLAGSAAIGAIAGGMGGGGGGRGGGRPMVGETAGRGASRTSRPGRPGGDGMTDSDVPLSNDNNMQRTRSRGGESGKSGGVVININKPMATQAEVGRAVHEAMRAWERQGSMS